ncbi:uncharacterized protein BX663DRAFT_504063 [Cokeromyces recurvatus]|uniref:uncharacterized protein n=1 Tax=Cokeromyces recurvatus TaxID=90255 RepID=UPI00222050B7|nr:uncharacterized protein BX663DRAFT_504063 [Cokeromyces recurvatus]KAI7904125.1 hypothetical protein BX663DRAFT_504063 [Cokeromyces recurvatus]
MRCCLQWLSTIPDPISFLLNRLLTHPTKYRGDYYSQWNIRWPTIQLLLYKVEYLQHDKQLPPPLIALDQQILN